MIYTELEVRGAKNDLHSGMYGGAAPNPFFALAHIIARLKDENGHILIPGFYDGIIPPSPRSWPPGAACPSTKSITADRVGSNNWWARPATACWSAHGAAHA